MDKELPRHAGGKVHGRVIVPDVDGPDEAPLEPRFVGDGPHDLPWRHPIPMSHLDAVADHLRATAVPASRAWTRLVALIALRRARVALLRELAGSLAREGPVVPFAAIHSVLEPGNTRVARPVLLPSLPVGLLLTASILVWLLPKAAVRPRLGLPLGASVPPLIAPLRATLCALTPLPGYGALLSVASVAALARVPITTETGPLPPPVPVAPGLP